MRKYTLASPIAKTCVDLRNYQNVIKDAVHQVMPKAEVTIEATCYCVTPSPTPRASQIL